MLKIQILSDIQALDYILKKYADPIEKMYEEASNMWGSNPV